MHFTGLATTRPMNGPSKRQRTQQWPPNAKRLGRWIGRVVAFVDRQDVQPLEQRSAKAKLTNGRRRLGLERNGHSLFRDDCNFRCRRCFHFGERNAAAWQTICPCTPTERAVRAAQLYRNDGQQTHAITHLETSDGPMALCMKCGCYGGRVLQGLLAPCKGVPTASPMLALKGICMRGRFPNAAS